MSLDKKNSINNILEEKRIFPPSKKFAENSNISTQEELLSLKKQASDDPIQFWDKIVYEISWKNYQIAVNKGFKQAKIRRDFLEENYITKIGI